MAQYQSFPDVPGDSHTLDKLKVLQLPRLEGRSFLDVGCNEGFFAGFAKFQGATRVLGIDHSAGFIERARRRFPDCEFRCADWNHLPEEQFDVILLASALHYADDQAALVRRLVERLTPDGVLVLEIGIASSATAEWVRVRRGIDERYFPSMPMVREVLSDYAWKWMGKSIPQAGDPVGRHVIHVSRRRPVAYLLMQPPGYGKSSIARRLFPPAGIPVVSGDAMLGEAAQGKGAASERLRASVAKDFSPFELDKIIQRAFAAGLCADMVRLWAGQAGEGDFAIDAYVPVEHQPDVEAALSRLGYLPVTLRWDKVGPRTGSSDAQVADAEAFYFSLAGAGAPAGGDGSVGPRVDAIGFVDELTLENGRLSVRGWAVDAKGILPERFHVYLRGRSITVDRFEKQSRPDVQRHLGLGHALVGYRFEVEARDIARLGDLADGFQVSGADGGVFRLAGPLAEAIAK